MHVLLGQLEPLPLAEGRRAAPDVDDDVEDGAAAAADELRGAFADLEVHAADDPAAEREWLSWTISSGIPSSLKSLRR